MKIPPGLYLSSLMVSLLAAFLATRRKETEGL